MNYQDITFYLRKFIECSLPFIIGILGTNGIITNIFHFNLIITILGYSSAFFAVFNVIIDSNQTKQLEITDEHIIEYIKNNQDKCKKIISKYNDDLITKYKENFEEVSLDGIIIINPL